MNTGLSSVDERGYLPEVVEQSLMLLSEYGVDEAYERGKKLLGGDVPPIDTLRYWSNKYQDRIYQYRRKKAELYQKELEGAQLAYAKYLSEFAMLQLRELEEPAFRRELIEKNKKRMLGSTDDYVKIMDFLLRIINLGKEMGISSEEADKIQRRAIRAPDEIIQALYAELKKGKKVTLKRQVESVTVEGDGQ